VELQIAVIVGTRPEAIKLAPVVLALQDCAGFKPVVVSTGQHPGLVDEVLGLFGIVPDISLKAFSQGQSLSSLTARLLEQFEPVFADDDFAATLVQGDTTSAFCGALSSFYADVPVAHVEAGLRTSTLRLPFPEEMNRRLITRLSERHYVPTETALQNLLAEGVSRDEVLLTGNTVVDATRIIGESVASTAPVEGVHGTYILCTMHRRENWGEGVEAACAAVLQLLDAHLALQVVLIKHPNPVVADLIEARLGASDRVTLLPPQPYQSFLALMKGCTFIISDSGGVVEEAPVFSKQVLIARDETERTEALQAGYAQLVGTDTDTIYQAASDLLTTGLAEGSVAVTIVNPYGDGHAASCIMQDLEHAWWLRTC